MSIYNNIYERWSIDYDLTWNASESLDWFSLSATSGHAYGTTPTSTVAGANIVGKGVGTYSGNIVFSSSMVSSLQNTTVPSSLTIAAQLAITITGSTELEVDETGSWTAGVSGGFTPYHYQWYYRLVCDELEKRPQPLKPPCGYWFTVGLDNSSWSHADNQGFFLSSIFRRSQQAHTLSWGLGRCQSAFHPGESQVRLLRLLLPVS
jgi:hypothetical protein